MSRECSCPTEHSITKLGHCRTCDAIVGLPVSDALLAQLIVLSSPSDTSLFVCGRYEHADGTSHDFDWATYADDNATYGVCRCGRDSVAQTQMMESR